MAEQKDFLKELSKEATKIDSFKEEKIEKINRPGLVISTKTIVLSIIFIALLVGGYFFFTNKSGIDMPDFVGKKTEEISVWARQYEIENTGIAISEEYNFDIDKDVVISQSVEANTKVSNDVKITFVVSLGADPEEKVQMINLIGSQENEVREWIKENKLTNTKINLVYSDKVEQGTVIEYKLKNVTEDNFTRGTNLVIDISKGEAPVGSITMEDFIEKTVAEVKSWAEKNKIELEIIETYNDTISKDMVISQSVDEGKIIKQNNTLTVTVSLGKAIRIPDFTTMSKEEYEAWKLDPKNAGLNFITHEKYNDDYSIYIMNQSVASNTMVESGTVVELDVSIGAVRLDKNYIGAPMQTLVDWCNKLRSQNTDMFAGQWGSTDVYSKTYRKGQIISMKCENSKGDTYNCDGDLPTDSRFSVVVSNGIEIVVEEKDLVDSASMVNFLATNMFPFSTTEIDGNVSELWVNGVKVSANQYIREGSSIVVKVAKELAVSPAPTTTPPVVDDAQTKCLSNSFGSWDEDTSTCTCQAGYSLVNDVCVVD